MAETATFHRGINLMFRISLGAVVIFFLLLLWSCRDPANTNNQVTGKGDEMHLGPGFDHFYRPREGQSEYFEIELTQGQFLHMTALQNGVDLAVEVSTSKEGARWTIDSPNGSYGPEEVLVIAEKTGSYLFQVKVGKLDAPTAEIRLTEVARRVATPDDLRAVEADRRYHAGRRLIRQGQVEEGIGELRRALETWQALGAARREAETLSSLALASERRAESLPTGRHEALESALGFSRRALTLFETVDHRRLATVLTNTATLELKMGQVEAARGRLERAVGLHRQFGQRRAIAFALSRLGNVWKSLGDFRLALGFFAEALAEIGDTPSPDRGQILLDSGSAFLTILRFEEAKVVYLEAFDIFRVDPNLQLQAGMALEGLAESAAHLGRHGEALQKLAEAETLLQTDEGRNQALFALTAGRVYSLVGNDLESRRKFELAISLAKKLGDAKAEALSRLELALVLAASGQTKEALELLDRALELVAESRDELAIASVRARRAALLAELGRFAEAQENIDASLATIESTRTSLQRFDQRLGYFSHRQEFFDIAISIAMKRAKSAQDAQFVEHAARLNERRLALELRARLLSRAPVKGRKASLGQDPSRLHDLLDEASVFLIYHLGEQVSFLWSIDHTGRVDGHELPSRAEIEQLAEHVALDQGSRRRHGQGADDVSRLANILLGPVADEIRGKRLVLVPDGALTSIAFGALPHPAQPGYVIEHHELVSVPSLGTLALLRERFASLEPIDSLVVFADPVFSGRDGRLVKLSSVGDSGLPEDLHRDASEDSIDLLARLPHSRKEAQAIAGKDGRMKVTQFLDFEATKQNFVRLAAERHGVFHIATHAAASRDAADRSALIFSRFDQTGQKVDGILRAAEVESLRFEANLVTLSACRTNVGPRVVGEGVFALTRAFLEAGALKVLSSQWQVPDLGTSRLMSAFYESYLISGRPAAAALREAQLELLKNPDTSDPSSWAGFQLAGDWHD
jgi:CHAT domain-containing protein